MINMQLYKVIENYEVAYPNPICLQVGESAQITKCETNPNWQDWVCCISSSEIGVDV